MANEPNFSANSDRLPPQNIEAEEAILGGILLDPEAIGRVAELIKADNFAVQAHQIIYHATLTLHLQGKPTDLMTVTSWLADQNQLEKVGGQAKLAQLVERTISAINIDQYSHLVVDKSMRRQLIYAGSGIIDLGYQTELELEEVLDRSEQLLLNLTQVRPQQSLVPIGETLINTFQDIEDRNEGVTLPGIPCGFYDLDAMTGGFQRSDLIIVAGRPSMGKCLSEDAEIVLADGSVATIAEIYRCKKANLLTLKYNLKFYITQPSAFIDDGIKPVFKITTKLGRSVEVTLTHPFLTQQGWQALSQLKVGDKIAVPRIINIFGNETLPEDEIIKLAHNYHNKFIPKIIFKLKRSLIALFLKKLFSICGNITINYSKKHRIIYNSDSQKILLQIQHLLLRFGIISCLKNSQKYWQLEITETDSTHIFISDIINNCRNNSLFSNQYRTQKEVLQNTAIATIEKQNLSTATIVKERQLHDFSKTDIYWDEIVSIEYTGFKQVYDLTIPETHNFVANDICVHNTSFAVGIAHNIAKTQNLSTAIYSLEMSKEQLVQRLLSSESRIESNRLRSGRISQAEWEPLTMAIGTLSELSIFIDDTPNITVTEMRSKARRLQAEQGGELGLVLIDYLQLMEGSSDNRVQELSRITRALKGMARELNVPVIALSQLSRGVEARTNKRPMMSDLRESGCLTGDSLISLADQEIEVPIRELIGKSGFPVWAINPVTMKLEKAIVSHVFSTGIKTVYQLKTALGRTIRATANHKFLTINGWQRLDQLEIGSRIALPRHIPSYSNLYKHNLSRERTLKLADRVQSETLTVLAESDVYWDKIISIKPDGDEEVYDLTVPGLHNFIANNIVVHNSIEQDADLVIMLYRDDYYNPDTPDRGISEIIITKHRNGPTGTVKLLFDPQFTRFRNLAASERYSFPKNPPNQLPPG